MHFRRPGPPRPIAAHRRRIAAHCRWHRQNVPDPGGVPHRSRWPTPRLRGATTGWIHRMVSRGGHLADDAGRWYTVIDGSLSLRDARDPTSCHSLAARSGLATGAAAHARTFPWRYKLDGCGIGRGFVVRLFFPHRRALLPGLPQRGTGGREPSPLFGSTPFPCRQPASPPRGLRRRMRFRNLFGPWAAPFLAFPRFLHLKTTVDLLVLPIGKMSWA